MARRRDNRRAGEARAERGGVWGDSSRRWGLRGRGDLGVSFEVAWVSSGASTLRDRVSGVTPGRECRGGSGYPGRQGGGWLWADAPQTLGDLRGPRHCCLTCHSMWTLLPLLGVLGSFCFLLLCLIL